MTGEQDCSFQTDPLHCPLPLHAPSPGNWATCPADHWLYGTACVCVCVCVCVWWLQPCSPIHQWRAWGLLIINPAVRAQDLSVSIQITHARIHTHTRSCKENYLSALRSGFTRTKGQQAKGWKGTSNGADRTCESLEREKKRTRKKKKKLTIFSGRFFLRRDRLFETSEELLVLFPVKQTYRRR